MIDQIMNAALAPFLEQVGWQGFAYGLLGLKTTKKMIEWARSLLGDRDTANE